MGARLKLNSAYTNGALLLAVAIGLACQSWSIFLVIAGTLIALQTAAGNIRH